MVRIPVTVIVPVKNEERNIVDCLSSVSWAEQVFVVDSGSTDKTRGLATASGATVVDFVYDGGWPKKKNWAIRNLPISTEWFLILDADERIGEELRLEIQSAIQNDNVNGFYIRWRFIFLGRWMRRCWSHGWMLRLVRTGCGEYEDLGMRGEGGWDNEVHENIVVSGKTGRLRSWLEHDSKQSLSYWIKKQNDFSDWNSARRMRQIIEERPSIKAFFSTDPLKRRKLFKAIFLRLPAKPVFIFLYLYVYRMGFLDGRAGLYFCALRAAHELQINAKLYEMRLKSE